MKALRGRILFSVATILAIAVLLFMWSEYQSAKSAAIESIDSREECLRIVKSLDRLRNAPRIASLDVEAPDSIAARVTSAAADAMLSPLSILAVDPQLPVRIGRTPYQVRATQIVLQNVSLGQIAGFAGGLEDVALGMVVRDLSLDRSRVAGENDSELWNVRLTLTQMIFSPISGS